MAPKSWSRIVIILIAIPAATSAQFIPAPGSPVPVGSDPYSVAVGDFNGDGKPDLAIANSGSNTVTVLLGNGTGGFTSVPGSPFPVGTNPASLAVADFNGDGKPDLAIANTGSNTVTVLLGNGTGGFTSATGSPFPVGTNPASLAVADFNGDGRPDLAIANSGSNTVTVLLGNGTGGFTSATGSPFAVGAAPSSVTEGDFNGDGKPDLAIANRGSNNVTVLLGTGTGSFTAAPSSPFAAGTNPTSLAAGDFNGDGRPDLAIANGGSNNVTVLLGTGTGGFTYAPGSPFQVGTDPASVAVRDFNGDGKPDLAIANAGSNTVTVRLGSGTGSFTAAPGSPFPAGTDPFSVAAADFNQDGEPDLAIVNAAGNAITVLLNSEANPNLYWQFTPAPGSPFAAGHLPLSVAVGDFNGDGKPDLATANRQDNTITVLLGSGTGDFTASPSSPFPVGTGPQCVVVGDFNGDSKLDLAIANTVDNSVTVLLGNGTGGFAQVQGSPFPVGFYPESLAVGDFNGDGKLDLAVANAGSNNVTVLLGNGAGGFIGAPGSPFAVGTFPLSVAMADFNRDGKPDLAVANTVDNTITVLLGNGAGGFTVAPGTPFPVGNYPVSLAVGDFNRDGKPDLATANERDNTVTVLLGNGAGSFTVAPGSPFAVGSNPESVAVADFNGDGVPDLATANYFDNTVTVLISSGTGAFAPAPGSPFPAGVNPTSLAAADFNQDGGLDLAAADALGNNVSVLLHIPAAQIATPVPGYILSGTLANLSWNTLPGATGYQLAVGTTPGGSNIFSGTIATTSQTVNFIPCTGAPVYVQLSADMNGAAQPAVDYTYPCKSATGDFNGDGFQDLLWQNNSSSQVNVNYYGGAGPQPQGSTVLDNGPDLTGVVLVGSADFDGNGTSDLVYQNSAFQVILNTYSGATLIGSVCLSCGINTTNWQVVAIADFNGDGKPDLVYQNTITHQVNVDYYGGSQGTTYLGFACLSCGLNVTNWQVKGAADFDGNGTPDLVYQNTSTHQVNVDYYGGSGGSTFLGFACLSCGLNMTDWQVVGAADMNADGIPDLIYQNTVTYQVNVDYYGGAGGSTLKSFNCLNCGAIVPGQMVRAVGKMTGSGEPDLIYQNTATNAVTVYYYGLGGAVAQGSACVSCGFNLAGWQLVGSGDFDGNGTPDLVYQNKTTNQVNVDYYSGPGGTTLLGFACLSCGLSLTNWKAVAVADLNGDGVPDLIYQNTQTHQVNVNYYGGAGGATFLGFACLSCGLNLTGWQLKAAADFNGDGVPDLVYQNTQTYQVNVDYYGGTGGATLTGFACLSCGLNLTNWQLVGASDFDGNGVPDLVYQNITTGQVNVDYYGGPGGVVLEGFNVLSAAGMPGWSVYVPKSR